MKAFQSYRQFLKWLASHDGKLSDKMLILLGGVYYHSPIEVLHAYEEN